MRNIKTEDDDDDPFDEKGILKDGRRFRVPMHMADSVQREIAAHARRQSQIRDGSGTTIGLHRPGFRLPSGKAGDNIRVARAVMYEIRDEALSQQYQNPVRKSAQGDNGDRSTGRNAGPDKRDSNDVEAAYRAYDQYVSNAWRGGKE